MESIGGWGTLGGGGQYNSYMEALSSRGTVYYSTSAYVNSSKKVVLNGVSSTRIPDSEAGISMSNKYWYTSYDSSTVYYGGSVGGVVYQDQDWYGMIYWTFDARRYNGHKVVPGDLYYSKGTTSYGNVSSASSGAYPANSYSGSYWYVSVGSDNIDPTAVTYPANIFTNQKVTITVTPRSNTYGGTISYKYEYTTNGTTWQVLNNSTTQTSVSLTVPDTATTFQARATAMDNMGFTSTTAISGTSRIVYNIDPISVTFNEEDLQVGNEIIVSITPSNSGYTGTISYIVQTNVNNTGWQTETESSSTNILLKIPDDAVSWAVRVQAKAEGYTSQTYIYGNGHTTGIAVKQNAGFSIAPENKHLGYIGTADLMQYYVSTENNINYTCSITLDGETIFSTTAAPGLQTLTLDSTKWNELSSTQEHTITVTATSNSKSISREYKFYKFVYDATTLPGLLDGIAEAIKIKQNVSKSFWGYRLPMEILKITGSDSYVTAYIDVTAPYIAGAKVMAVSMTGEIYSVSISQTGTTRIEVSEKGDYVVSAVIGNITSDTKKVSISTEGEVKTATVSFICVNVTTAVGANIVATLNGLFYSVTTTSNITNLYLPSKGNWTITATKGNLTNQQVVQVTAFTTYSVDIPLYDTIFANNDWADISAATKAGLASSYWTVGDQKSVILNGGVGDLTFNNETYYVYILGFNHNSLYEGNNTIHLAFGKKDGKDTAFCDSKYNTSVSDACFHMNATNTNNGGWSGSYMRNTICSQFINVLPVELRNVITTCNKYTDNVGGGTNSATSVTATSDKIWLLAAYEVFGIVSDVNSNEQNQQQRYDYYANGNSTVRYNHNATESSVFWYLRSPINTDYNFSAVYENGTIAKNLASNISLGFVPCFQIS